MFIRKPTPRQALGVQQTKRFNANRSLLMFSFLLLSVGSAVLLLQQGNVAASNSDGRRALTHHKFAMICSTTRVLRARCLAEVSVASNGHPLTGNPSTSGSYGPTQFHTAYNLPCTPGGAVAAVCATPSSFGPTTIAIVDAGNFSTGTTGLQSSLQAYDQYYGLPTCTTANTCLDVVNQTGSTTSLPGNAGWSDEIALDVETAHMVCQTCKILLVEANDDALADLAAANATAATFDPVSISNSWGSDTDDSSLDSDFKFNGIAEVAATGDTGSVSNGASWPSDVPQVVSAAGTTLQLNNDNTWASETVWDDSGGGCATGYGAPSWQTSLSNWSSAGCGTYRAFGDIAADGDPNTGAAVNINSTWYEFGGTSLSSPLIASIFALAGPIATNISASQLLYTAASSSNLHDITSGTDCTSSNVTHCTAGSGFDTPSGLGSPDGTGDFTAAPSQPTSLTALDIDQNHINLSWNASSASSGIEDYAIYRNNTQVTTTTSTSYTDSGLAPNTTYQYDVIAYSNQGSYSAASSTASAIASYPADVNQDGHINLLDLSILAGQYSSE
jgi:subtilase family serine protease